MALSDFSFNNSEIKAYFEGSNAYVPSAELIYLHSHPLIKPNFLDQMEALILKTTQLIQEKRIKGSVIEKLSTSASKFGAELPNITMENAPTILGHLRDIYKLCTSLLKDYNVV
jgi:hypothetical protein